MSNNGSQMLRWRRNAQRTLIRVTLGLAATLFLASPALAQTPAATTVRIGGTGSGSVLIQRLIEEYKKTRPGVNFEVVMPVLGSGGGLRALAVNRIDMAVLARLPKPEEQRDTLVVTPWVETPLVLATSGGKKTGGFDTAGYAALLRKGSGTWDDGAHIHLVLRYPHENDNAILAAYSAGLKSALEAASRSLTVTVADTDLDAIDLLARIPGSLGTTTLGMIKVKGSAVTPLPFNGFAPSLPALRNGSYPLAKKLYLAHHRAPGASATEFIGWLNSPRIAARLQEFDYQVMPR